VNEEAHEGFVRAVSRPDDAIDLAEAALWYAREEYPDLDPSRPLAVLDDLAREATRALQGDADPWRQVQVLNRVLFDEFGLRGNGDDYYDPRNSFLNEVLDRRLGIPITLSVIYMAVAGRAGVAVHGVGLPGHFLVRLPTEGDGLFVDPFHAGAILTEEDCQRRLDETYGDVPLRTRHLAPLPRRDILARMLYNLKAIYIRERAFPKALWVLEKLLVLRPESPLDLRDRGLLRYGADRYDDALGDLRRYLQLRPEAEDVPQIRITVKTLETLVSILG
jgi:regulator of sirC expression with transglutaminase-like and TPR domain